MNRTVNFDNRYQKHVHTEQWAKDHFQHADVHLYGAVCPGTGQTEALISPYLGGAAMRQHLKQISEATASGRHAVIIMDRTSWHMGDVGNEFKTSQYYLYLPIHQN